MAVYRSFSGYSVSLKSGIKSGILQSPLDFFIGVFYDEIDLNGPKLIEFSVQDLEIEGFF